MDTKYFIAAFKEASELWKQNNPTMPELKVGDLTLSLLSTILRRAQSLKESVIDTAIENERRTR